MERFRDPELLAWLDENSAGPYGDAAGYDAEGWDASTWLLHAMYENPRLPSNLTHDDVYRIKRDAEPAVEPGSVEDILADTTVVGAALGRSARPGADWRRLTWQELGRRLGSDPFTPGVPPCYRSFPYRSWPANISPPAEGSLDREQFQRLVQLLAGTAGADVPCVALYATIPLGDYTEPYLYRGALSELLDLYDNEDLPGSPSNIWPHDRAWFVYTNADLWATKISGRTSLIENLHRDPELDTADPW